MGHLSQARCFNHASREAAVLCLECRRFFCRECVTEHDGRALCAPCLQKRLEKPRKPRRNLGPLLRGLQCLAGLVLTWLLFYALGQALLAIPTAYHEGTVWRHNLLNEP